MDSSQLTRYKKDRYTANALNGVQPRPIYPIDEEKRIGYKNGSKIVTYNKRTVLPGCTGPTCNEDFIPQPQSQSQGTFVFNQIDVVYQSPGEIIVEVVVDSQNTMYFVESFGGPAVYRLRKLVGQTVTEIMTFYDYYSNLALDGTDQLYFLDQNSLGTVNLKMYNNNSQSITTYSIITSLITLPGSFAINKSTNDLYISSGAGANIIKTDTVLSNQIQIPATGEGYLDNTIGNNTRFNNPQGLTFDSGNNCLYIADYQNNCIRKLDLSGSSYGVSTYAGDVSTANPPTSGPLLGPPKTPTYNLDKSLASFNGPRDIEIDENGNLFIMDTNNNQINFLNTSTGKVTLFAGNGNQFESTGTPFKSTGNPLLDYQFNLPNNIFVKSSTQIYVANRGAGTILLITGSYQ